MKKLALASVLSAAALSSYAAPLVTIGDQLDLFFRGAITGKWDSNVTYAQAPKKVDDYSAVFRVGAEADYGRNSKFKANVKFFEDMTRYAQHKEFNSNLSKVYATASYTETTLVIKADFSFEQLYQNSSTTLSANDAGQLVRFNRWNAGVDGQYDVTEKVFTEMGGRWTRTEYLAQWQNSYSDNDMYSLPVSILYRITPKISAGLTYQYRYTEFTGGQQYASGFNYGSNRNDHFAGLNVRGELLPKLVATVYLGGSYRKSSGGYDSDTTFAMNASLTYAITSKVSVYGKGFRDFGSGASRESSLNTGCEVGAIYSFNEFISASAGFNYTNYDYMHTNSGGSSRNDDSYQGRIGVNYNPNRFLTLGANYRYTTNCSNWESARYNQHMVDISVAVKY